MYISGSAYPVGATLTYRIDVYSGKLSQNLQDEIFAKAFDVSSIQILYVYFLTVKCVKIPMYSAPKK